jgi:hypothetical protein
MFKRRPSCKPAVNVMAYCLNAKSVGSHRPRYDRVDKATANWFAEYLFSETPAEGVRSMMSGTRRLPLVDVLSRGSQSCGQKWRRSR